MRMGTLGFAAALAVFTPTLYAASDWQPVTDTVSMFYMSIPVGGHAADGGNRYGFRLLETNVSPVVGRTTAFDLTDSPPTLLDYSFDGKTGLPSFKVNGVETMTYRTTYNVADGSTQTEVGGVNWGLVIIGAVGAGLLVKGLFIDPNNTSNCTPMPMALTSVDHAFNNGCTPPLN